MNSDALLAYLHFAAIFGTVSLLAVELALLTQPAMGQQLHRLRSLDGLYGMFAVSALVTGAARVIWGAKGSSFYLSNPVFHAKVGLFLLAALISIFPTAQFFKWSKAARSDVGYAPDPASAGRVRVVVVVQLVVLAAIPLAATLMARGIGM